MDKLVVTLQTLDRAKLYYNVLQQTFVPRVIERFLVQRYLVDGRRWELKDDECPDIYRDFILSQVFLGGHAGRAGAYPNAHRYDSHSEALHDQRSALAVLLHYTRDNAILFEQRPKT